MNFGHLLFSFHGRANRAKVWLFALLTVVVWTIIIIAGVAMVGVDRISQAGARPDTQTMQKLFEAALVPLLLALVVWAVLFYCTLAVLAKRLHDRGRSGWWLLIFLLLPGFISGVGNAMTMQGSQSGNAVGAVLSLISLGIYVWGFVELYCLRGTVGDNAYGPDPIIGSV